MTSDAKNKLPKADKVAWHKSEVLWLVRRIDCLLAPSRLWRRIHSGRWAYRRYEETMTRITTASISVKEPDTRDNNLGFLRLVFAILVIFSHSSELVDGNRDHELLTRLFGTISAGDLAVDGFFLISGYLITQSFLNSRSPANYLSKRVLRIYPGFLVAYLICIIIAPLVGGALHPAAIFKAFALKAPQVEGVFPGTNVPVLNQPMWTIAYEFRCYLLVPALGFIGFYSRRRILAACTLLLIMVAALRPDLTWVPHKVEILIGGPEHAIRFTALFACGTMFYLYRDRIVYRAWPAAGGA